jgi:hypothetical protein
VFFSHRRITASAAVGSALALTLGFAAVTSLDDSAGAAAPASGTLTDTSGPVTWSGGPLVGTLVGSSLLGTAQCTPGACDEFGLTVNVPDGYATDHSVALTLTNTGTDDYDVYVVDDATGDVVATGAKAGDEAVTLPASDASYIVRVVAYMPATGEYAASAAVTSGGTGTTTPPPPAPGDPGAPSFTDYPAPDSLQSNDKNNAGEPSIGTNFATGATLYQASLSTYKVAFDDSATPATAAWSDVSANAANGCPQGSTLSLDPILFTDHETGRTFESQLTGVDSFTCYTDDDGATWSPSTGGGIPSGVDHQTIGGGPFASADAVGQMTDYPHDVYYCSQDIATAFCAASHNGGQTFEAGVPVYTLADCGGLHGHLKVAPDGTAYLPNKDCGDSNQAVVVTTDGGLTWTVDTIPGSKAGDSDPSVGIGRDGTVYVGMVGVNTDSSGKTTSSIPAASVSHDQGKTWSPVQALGASAGIKNAVFPTAVAGDDDRAAIAYLGTTEAGDYQDAATFHGVWHLFIDMTYDGGQTWTTYDATPNDPVQRGSICTGGTTCGSDRNLLDFIDSTIDSHGRVLVGFADGCTQACATDPTALRHDAYATIARQSTGRTLFAKFDPVTTTTPPPAATHNLAVTQAPLRRDGSRLTSTFTLANTGGVDEPLVVLRIRDNGELVRRVTLSLGAGEQVRRTFHFTGDRGRNVVIGRVDPRNRIVETDEHDNSARRTTWVR